MSESAARALPLLICPACRRISAVRSFESVNQINSFHFIPIGDVFMKIPLRPLSSLILLWMRSNLSLAAAILTFVFSFAAAPLHAQDDVTTQNASSALDGGWITGPASNPLSFLNGPANRTFGSKLPYDFPDFHPASYLDARVPKWLNFEVEERFRYEAYDNSGFKQGNDDSYLLNRLRLQADLRFNSWFKLVSQAQDARPVLQNPPYGPPNEV